MKGRHRAGVVKRTKHMIINQLSTKKSEIAGPGLAFGLICSWMATCIKLPGSKSGFKFVWPKLDYSPLNPQVFLLLLPLQKTRLLEFTRLITSTILFINKMIFNTIR